MIDQQNRLDGSSSLCHCGHLSLGESGQVVGAGGDNVGGLSRDQGAVGVGDKAGEASSVDGWTSDGGDWETVGGQVVSAGSDNSRLVSRDNSAVGVGDQTPWGTITGPGASSRPASGVASPGSSWGKSWESSSDGSNWETLGGEVVGTGSDNSGLVSGDDSAVGVGHKAERPLGASDSHGGGEDSHELHVCCWVYSANVQ